MGPACSPHFSGMHSIAVPAIGQAWPRGAARLISPCLLRAHAKWRPTPSAASHRGLAHTWCLRREAWGLSLEDSWVWELDSSSEAKWSRHMVVRVPGAAFASNAAMGAFVRELLAKPQVGEGTC